MTNDEFDIYPFWTGQLFSVRSSGLVLPLVSINSKLRIVTLESKAGGHLRYEAKQVSPYIPERETRDLLKKPPVIDQSQTQPNPPPAPPDQNYQRLLEARKCRALTEPKTTTVNGFIVPTPMTDAPVHGQKYYVLSASEPMGYAEWTQHRADAFGYCINNRMAYASEEAAQAVVLAMQGLDPKWPNHPRST